MTFFSIVYKTFFSDIKKYKYFFIVNSIIIAMLFMYISLLYNPSIINNKSKDGLYYIIKFALSVIVIFSVVFVTYTNISFLKSRGREFGVYSTLGMTTKELKKILFFENASIMVSSMVFGIICGTLVGRLFYMGLNKLLSGAKIEYTLDYRSFVLTILTFFVIFFANYIFNAIYIKRKSIVDILKSKTKMDVFEINYKVVIVSIVSIILMIISMYAFPKLIIKDIKYQKTLIIISFILIIFGVYNFLLISIELISRVVKHFPKVYNRNIISLKNLSHRFIAYKNILFMSSILIAGTVCFVGFVYSIYNSTKESIEELYPYDIMMVQNNKYNNITKDELEENLVKWGANIKEFKNFEMIKVPYFFLENGNYVLWDQSQAVISQSSFNSQTYENVTLNEDEVYFIRVSNEKEKVKPKDGFLCPLSGEKIEIIEKNLDSEQSLITKNKFDDIAKDEYKFNFSKDGFSSKSGVRYINFGNNAGCYLDEAVVVNDKIYNELKSKVGEDDTVKVNLLNLKNGDKAYKELVNYLDSKNSKEKYTDECIKFKPMYKEDILHSTLEKNGTVVFTMIFIGILFIVANITILFYKSITNIDYDNDRIISLIRLGVLKKEIENIVSRELFLIFFMPVLTGGVLGMYFLYCLVSNTNRAVFLMQKSLLVIILVALSQIAFYFICRKKYLYEMNRKYLN